MLLIPKLLQLAAGHKPCSRSPSGGRGQRVLRPHQVTKIEDVLQGLQCSPPFHTPPTEGRCPLISFVVAPFSHFRLWYKPSLCQCLIGSTGSTFPQTVPVTAITVNKIGQLPKAAVFNPSLLLPATACGMAAWQQGRSCL